MNDLNQKNSPDDDLMRDGGADVEILIGRIIDGEGSAEDRQRFERQAGADPQLWRRLAMRHQDMAALAAKVGRVLDSGERIDLPGDSAIAFRAPWIVAIAGWAAVIALAILWGITTLNGREFDASNTGMIPAADPGDLTPDEHLKRYLRAPFVRGEMPPTLLDVQDVPEGRKALRILRRIEEVVYIPAEDALPVDDRGDLTKPPEELRQNTPELPYD